MPSGNDREIQPRGMSGQKVFREMKIAMVPVYKRSKYYKAHEGMNWNRETIFVSGIL